MKLLLFFTLLILAGPTVSAQERLIARNGGISFFSKTPLENIEAHTKTAVSVLDKKTGQIEFSVLIKSFTFEKALMQEHFNENYLESDRFPKSVFKGRIGDPGKVDFNKDGKFMVPVTGELTIHGETKTVTAPVSFTTANGETVAHAEFDILLADYKINIPALSKDKISKTVKIVVELKYESLTRP